MARHDVNHSMIEKAKHKIHKFRLDISDQIPAGKWEEMQIQIGMMRKKNKLLTYLLIMETAIILCLIISCWSHAGK